MTSELAGVPESRVHGFGAGHGDPRREAVFSFARKVTRDPASVRREDVDALRKHGFTDAQVVELTLAVCRYNTMNRLADAFGVPLESENVFAPPAAAPDARP
jgi:alkylhydroperoxidase family enzyme